ncbi:three-helix bundle dimerization domain-containing protein [Rhodococcus erythropolis]|uniref:three-helix bundle dimerization domain-containing protein n=1 Tax=Rhodococcus erythropolis TaxID=1833 RepID=UPI00352E3685
MTRWPRPRPASGRSRRPRYTTIRDSTHLAAAFPSAARDRVDTVVEEAYHRFDPAHVRDFIPLLVERHAKESLAAQVRA